MSCAVSKRVNPERRDAFRSFEVFISDTRLNDAVLRHCMAEPEAIAKPEAAVGSDCTLLDEAFECFVICPQP